MMHVRDVVVAFYDYVCCYFLRVGVMVNLITGLIMAVRTKVMAGVIV